MGPMHAPTPLGPSRLAAALVLVVWLAGLGCAPSPSATGEQREEPRSVCLPLFPDRDGWLGGDSAYSVPLPIGDGRAHLWLFGDSFVQRPGAGAGRQYPLIHNSIGLSRCEDDGRFHVDYFWRGRTAKMPRAFFEPDPRAPWARRVAQRTGRPAYYWPLDGFVAHDVLFVGLLRVGFSEPRGPLRLPFRPLGVDLARIENWRDPPGAWRIRLSTLSESPVAFPGTSFVPTEDAIHAFAFVDRAEGRAPRILARLPLQSLRRWQPDLSGELAYWSRSSRWKPGFDPDDAEIVMADDASEMSVHLDAETSEWIAVYGHPTRTGDAAPSRTLWGRRSPRLEGPWSDPTAMLEMQPDPAAGASADGEPEELFCYAAKAHPRLSARRRLVVTWVCSLFARREEDALSVLAQLRDTPELYRPRAVATGAPGADPHAPAE